MFTLCESISAGRSLWKSQYAHQQSRCSDPSGLKRTAWALSISNSLQSPDWCPIWYLWDILEWSMTLHFQFSSTTKKCANWLLLWKKGCWIPPAELTTSRYIQAVLVWSNTLNWLYICFCFFVHYQYTYMLSGFICDVSLLEPRMYITNVHLFGNHEKNTHFGVGHS